MSERIWVLGAPDPEMEAIEGLLRECGETVVYAADARGERVTAGAAYRGESLVTDVGNHPCTSGVTTVYLVECELLTPDVRFAPGEDICHPELADRTVRRIDHHRPGDPGYGLPPNKFFAASSIGQVCAVLGCAVLFAHRDDACRVLSEEEGAHGWHYAWSGLGQPLSAIGGPFGPPVRPGANRWTTGKYGLWDGMPLPGRRDFSLDPGEAMLIAAADHCLGAAYRGECPGVDPDELMRWRAESRAKFQGRTVDEVLADVERAQEALRAAPELVLLEDPCSAVVVRDMRQPVDQRPTRELPEAAVRLGIGYVSGPLVGPDGRQKITCSGTADQVRAFLDHWAPAQGLVGAYGDPERGFAGAYLTAALAEYTERVDR